MYSFGFGVCRPHSCSLTVEGLRLMDMRDHNRISWWIRIGVWLITTSIASGAELTFQPPPPIPWVNESLIIEDTRLSNHPTIRAMHKEAIERRNGRQIKLDEDCCIVAQRWANYMAKTSNFNHGGGGYRAQIIAMGYGTVERCFTGWMTSKKGHRGIVLTSRYTKCGWGFQKSSSGRCYWVGSFR